MDYSFRYARRRGLTNGNPTHRYKRNDKGDFVSISGISPGALVRVLGNDTYILGGGHPDSGTRTVIEEYIFSPAELERARLRGMPVTRAWRTNAPGDTYNWVYWEYDLELI